MIATHIDCTDLDAEVAWFRDELGFSIHLVSPADDPARVVLRSKDGAVDLRRGEFDRPASLVVEAVSERTMTSPGGTSVAFVRPASSGPVGAEMPMPPSQPSLTVVAPSDDFGVGRAGMEYRDLLPDRWGGRFIASHIRIHDGGDVDDWVHFHRIRFQMIYVAAGWVDVVYEDQGAPFRMHAGDCVVQPPEIRHRVLRSSPGLEVIEIGCPAEHDTISDPSLALPNGRHRPDRDFAGQRFTRHVAADAELRSWVDPSWDVRETGIGSATTGLADAVVVSPSRDRESTGETEVLAHDGEFVLVVGLSGNATIEVGERSVALTPRTSLAIPPDSLWAWRGADEEHRSLVIEMPAAAIRLA
ncbi:MAG: cupin [Ilumatobacter sp.]